MLKTILILLFVAHANGHRNKLQNDADFQTSLMPQELNPEFVSAKDSPWQAVLPIRQKRDTTDVLNTETTIAQVKRYSRIIACIVLALSAAVEITVYIIENYFFEPVIPT